MFFEDALLTSRELEITLTGKDCGLSERAPMAGIPHHAADVYASKLIEKGYKVAICEQLTDPKESKGLVERGVIRILTPGTIVESNLLEEKKNNYIMSICKGGIYFGISVCDISTGEFYSSEIKCQNNFELLLDEIARYTPSELVEHWFNMIEAPRKELHWFEEAGHNPLIDNPSEFKQLLVEKLLPLIKE